LECDLQKELVHVQRVQAIAVPVGRIDPHGGVAHLLLVREAALESHLEDLVHHGLDPRLLALAALLQIGQESVHLRHDFVQGRGDRHAGNSKAEAERTLLAC
jgi:hypothetical protein